MKKSILTVVLAFILCFATLSVRAAAAEDELTRAMGLGIVSELPGDEPISASAFFAMLDRAVERTDGDALTDFQALYPAARISDALLTRYDGMVAVLAAAECLDSATLNVDNWFELHEQMGMETCWDTIRWNVELFGETWGSSVDGMEWYREASAYFYSFGRRSVYSGRTIFDYDAESNSMRTDQPFTHEEAALAALRLHDSMDGNFPVTNRVIGTEEQALLEAAEERIEDILNSETEVSYTGTAYYVSNGGDDENDGLTPETAWATLKRVNETDLLTPGTAVFFERGGLWRGRINTWPGVTYSAYGEGEKPRLYASPESGVGEEKWTLWHDEDGVKIWKYHTRLQDPGGIVMDGGEVYASRVYALWDGEKAVVWDDPDREFDVVEALEQNLQFCCGFPEDLSPNIPYPAYETKLHGDVYLRCDAGNPGTLYGEIEFQCPAEPMGYCGIIQCNGDGCVIDNLCLMYSNTMGVATGANRNITVQNCEVAFVGGGSHIIGAQAAGMNFVPVSGEGIRLDGYGNSALNNYVHDCFDGGIIFEPDLQFELDGGDISDEMLAIPWGKINIEGNVIERCASGVLVGVHCEDEARAEVSDLTIRDNDILYCGYGWSGDDHYDCTWFTPDYDGNAITFWNDDYPHGTYLVENNRLFAAKAALVHMVLRGENAPVFSGNTYSQHPNGYVLHTWDERIFRAVSTDYAGEKCGEVLGDAEAYVMPFAGEITRVSRKGDTITVQVACGDPAMLAVAAYDGSGKLLWLQTGGLLGAAPRTFTADEELPASAEVKVFLCSAEGWFPLCGAWE